MPDPIGPPYGTRAVEGGDLLIPPGSHAFVQKINTGDITVCVGPKTVTFSGQERPVKFDDATDSFAICDRLDSIRKNVNARQGEYVILENPAADRQSSSGLAMPNSNSTMSGTPELSMGRRVVIRGPIDFALWPRQKATVVQGHHLRSNQYLEATCYDPESAKENWNRASVVAAPPASQVSGNTETKTDVQQTTTIAAPPSLVVGQRLIIKGTEVSFYIPPTGIEISAKEESDDAEDDSFDRFVRDAVTLERLEYCILVEENGRKRYEVGPQVVFPAPTEHFIRSSDARRKFRAIELPQKAGIHIKVIADYKDDGGIDHKIGQELFITGDEQSIYYPREEHSIISYGDGQNKIHYGIAIPKGEGRYVMNRLNGDIRVETGPTILLCDPRKDVIVRRILSDKQCEDWYPLNSEVMEYNRNLRQIQTVAGTSNSRSDVVEERMLSNRAYGSYLESYGGGAASSSLLSGSSGVRGFAPASTERSSKEIVGEEFRRGTSYSPPRAITLNTKFDGVPTIEIWSGYAVQVVSRTGERRVEMGPKAVLLSYDETLEQMFLSTSKPKTTDKLMRTVYLRTQNNKVSDIVEVETSDHVRCDIKMSFAVNFEEQHSNIWFSCENYVKLLCDHVRSILKGEVKKRSIEDFYKTATQVVRDVILGDKRTDPANPAKSSRAGMFFAENGMRVTDVEVLGVEIKDQGIATLLNESQRKVVQTNIDMATRQRELQVVQQTEEIERKKMQAKADTETTKAQIEQDKIKLILETAIQQHEANLQEVQSDLNLAEERRNGELAQFKFRLENEKAEADQVLEIKKAQTEQEIETRKRQSELNLSALKAETEAIVAKFKACEGNFTETLALLCREDNATKIAQAASWQTVIGKKSIGDVLTDMFGKDSPIAAAISGTLQSKGLLSSINDGSRERSGVR